MDNSSKPSPEINPSGLKTAMHKAKAKGKAKIRAKLAKDAKAEALQANSPLKSPADMMGFLKQYPKTKRLLGEIINVWRRATARRPGVEGFWAAYLYPWWSEKSKLPQATLKRHLNRLEEHGLIERQRGHFAGVPGMIFMRPTALALELSGNRFSDRKHLGAKEKTVAPATIPVALAGVKEQPKFGDDDYVPQTHAEMMAIFNSVD